MIKISFQSLDKVIIVFYFLELDPCSMLCYKPNIIQVQNIGTAF